MLELIAFSFGTGILEAVHAVRIARAGLWIGPDRIVIRGPVKTWRLQPSDVDTFSPALWAQGTPCPVLALKSGGRVGVWALGGPGQRWRYKRTLDELEPLCANLNRALETVRSGSAVLAPDALAVPSERALASRLRRRVYALAMGQAGLFWAAVVIDLVALNKKNELLFVVCAALDTLLALVTALVVRAGVLREQAQHPDRPSIGP